MIKRAPTPLHEKARGQSLVEFAFVSIFLFLLLFGIIEMGRLLYAFNVVSNAAQEGSRYAITRPYDMISESEAATSRAAGTAIPTQVVVADGSCNIYDNAREKALGITRSDVRLSVTYENASGTPVAPGALSTNPDSGNYYGNVMAVGNRVVVEASYRFDFLVPLLSQFAPDGIDVKMSSARSIVNNGSGAFNCAVNYEPAPAPPTETNTPLPTNTATRTSSPTRTSTNTTTPVATNTSTPTASATRTATATSTNTATATSTPENKLILASVDVYKESSGNNEKLDVVVYVVDQNGAFVTDATLTGLAFSSIGSGYSQAERLTTMNNKGGGRYELCAWGKFSGGVGAVTVRVTGVKVGYQTATTDATNKLGTYCNSVPTSTSTPTKTSTPTNTVAPTFTPTKTPTFNPSITSTPTTGPTDTYTPTPPPTLTPQPSYTPTPASCPYVVTVTGYKASGNQRVYVSVQVKNTLGSKVAGARVEVTLRSGEVRRGDTDNAGNLCLVFNRYLGSSVSGDVNVSGAECPVTTQSFTTTTSGGQCR